MSYSFHVFVTAPDLEGMVAALTAALPEVSVDASSGAILVRVDDWTLRGDLNDASWVSEEADGIVSAFGDGMSDEQRAVMRESTARIEFEPSPGADTDDHYNTWLKTAETLGELAGAVAFFPSDASFIG